MNVNQAYDKAKHSVPVMSMTVVGVNAAVSQLDSSGFQGTKVLFVPAVMLNEFRSGRSDLSLHAQDETDPKRMQDGLLAKYKDVVIYTDGFSSTPFLPSYLMYSVI